MKWTIRRLFITFEIANFEKYDIICFLTRLLLLFSNKFKGCFDKYRRKSKYIIS